MHTNKNKLLFYRGRPKNIKDVINEEKYNSYSSVYISGEFSEYIQNFTKSTIFFVEKDYFFDKKDFFDGYNCIVGSSFNFKKSNNYVIVSPKTNNLLSDFTACFIVILLLIIIILSILYGCFQESFLILEINKFTSKSFSYFFSHWFLVYLLNAIL